MLWIIIVLVFVAAGWIFLVPHYNGRKLTWWIGSSHEPIQEPLHENLVSVKVVEELPEAPRRPKAETPKPFAPKAFPTKPPNFIPADTFEGPRSGYVFKNDARGVGYYIDRPRVEFSHRETHEYKIEESPSKIRHGVTRIEDL